VVLGGGHRCCGRGGRGGTPSGDPGSQTRDTAFFGAQVRLQVIELSRHDEMMSWRITMELEVREMTEMMRETEW